MDGEAVCENYGFHAGFSQTGFTGDHAGNHGVDLYKISRASRLESAVVVIDTRTFFGNTAKEGASTLNLDTSELTP